MDEEKSPPTAPAPDRRNFLIGSVMTGAIPLVPAAAASPIAKKPLSPDGFVLVEVDLHVNGRTHHIKLDPRTTLVDALRERIDLTGTKKGCDHGQCGACTVLIEGQRQLSCLMLAVSLGTREVTTVEGLSAPDGRLHPMQQAFIDHDAFQCGYCTPGQILSGIGCVREGHVGSAAEISEYMSGNLCRCAAYPNIVAAVAQASQQMKG